MTSSNALNRVSMQSLRSWGNIFSSWGPRLLQASSAVQTGGVARELGGDPKGEGQSKERNQTGGDGEGGNLKSKWAHKGGTL